MVEISGENGTESESQAFLEGLIQQLDDPAQQTMPAGLGKLLVGFMQRLDHQLMDVTRKLESTVHRLSVAEEMLFANASSLQQRQQPKPAQVPKAQGASTTQAAPKAREAPRVQTAPKAQAAPKAPVLAPKAQAKSPPPEDAPRMQAEQPAPKAKAPLPSLEQLAPKAKAPVPSVEKPAPKAQAPSPSADMQDKMIQCPDCEGLFAWSDYSEGDYKDGWGCNNGEAGCHHNSKTDGMFRWFCPLCMNDFCRACGEIEAQAQAMMEPGELGDGKTAQDAADALMQEAEAIMKAEFSPEEQSGPVIALASGNSKPSKAPQAAKTGRAAASLPNVSELTQAAGARDIAALLPDDAKLARAAGTGEIAALLPDDSQLASVQKKHGVVGTSAMALGAAASKAAPLPKKAAQSPSSMPKPAEVAVVQAQGEEVIEEEEGEEEEEVVEDGTVEPEAVPLAVPTNTHAEVTTGTGQVVQEATVAVDQEEVIEEEEEEEEENVEDETVEPGEAQASPEAAAEATEPEEPQDAADSQLMAQLTQTVKRKARVVVASTPGKRLRAAT